MGLGPKVKLAEIAGVRTAAIAVDEHVYKYGEVIGVAIRAIPVGAHVHVHNVLSARLPGDAAR